MVNLKRPCLNMVVPSKLTAMGMKVSRTLRKTWVLVGLSNQNGKNTYWNESKKRMFRVKYIRAQGLILEKETYKILICYCSADKVLES